MFPCSHKKTDATKVWINSVILRTMWLEDGTRNAFGTRKDQSRPGSKLTYKIIHGSSGWRHSHANSFSGCVLLRHLCLNLPCLKRNVADYPVSSLTSIHLNPLGLTESTLIYSILPISFFWPNSWRLASGCGSSTSQEGLTSGGLQLLPHKFHLNRMQSVCESLDVIARHIHIYFMTLEMISLVGNRALPIS